MTIEVTGHVASMTTGMNNRVRLTIHLEARRSGEPLIVEASKEEMGGLYLPGTVVKVMVRPEPSAPSEIVTTKDKP